MSYKEAKWIKEYRLANKAEIWPDFGKPTIYTQEALKIITSISSNLKYNFDKQPD